MAKKEHLIKLQLGVNIWNNWRNEHPGIIPVLNEINLSNTNLTNVNLNWANLCETNLCGTNLSHADLSAANLKGADLSGADFYKVDLSGANLRGTKLNAANLRKANLTGADLSDADITGADIHEANFTQANISRLIGANVKIEDFFTVIKSDLGSVHTVIKSDLRSDHSENSAGPIRDQAAFSKELSYFQNKIVDKERIYIPGIILYTEQDTISYYTRDCFEYIDALTGNSFNIYLLEKPPLKWKNSIFYWKQILEFYLYKLIPLLQWCRILKNKPYSKLEVYDIARQWKIDISNFPCLVIFNPCNVYDKLIFNIYKDIPLKELEYYFRDLFSELYKSIPTENSEKNEQLLSEYNKYFNTIKENYLSIVEILEAKYLKPDNKDKQQKEAHQVWYINNSQFAGGLVNADTVNAHQIGGNITNYNSEQRQNLAEAAAEIQQLLNQLGQTYPTNTPLEKQIAVTEALKQIDSNPTLKARVIGALKAGETEAFKELVDNPLINILVATLEGWQDVE